MPGPCPSNSTANSDGSTLRHLLSQQVVIAQLLFTAGYLAFVAAVRLECGYAAIVAAIVTGAGKATAGHTATAGLAPLPSIMLFAHIAVVAFWLGSLVCLHRSAKRTA